MHQHHVQCVVRWSGRRGGAIFWRLAFRDFRTSGRRRGCRVDLAIDTSLLVPDAILTCRVCLIALRPRCERTVAVHPGSHDTHTLTLLALHWTHPRRDFV
jgi:hypothetical protein